MVTGWMLWPSNSRLKVWLPLHSVIRFIKSSWVLRFELIVPLDVCGCWLTVPLGVREC